MSKIRIGVLVSGGGTNLQALIDAQNRGEIPHGEIALVLSNREDAYALTRAKKAGIPATVVTKKEQGSQQAFEEAVAHRLCLYGIDMVVLAGFMAILSKDFTDKYPNRIINIHPSLIPSFCGAGYYGLKVHQAALEKGVKVTGATVHYVNEIPDGGEILMQQAVDILPGDTPQILQKRVMEQAEWRLLPKAAELVAEKLYKEGF